jgi:hypothetical protein
VAELHLYDFDSTLFRSPHPPAVWDGGWWGDGRSLTPPCVPDQPGDSWWIMPTVNRAKKSIADPNVFAVMMTGRRDNSAFRYRVPDLLRQRGLDFNAVHLDPGGPDSIKINKLRRVLQYLQRYPQIDTVRAWDDRKSHLQDFGKVLRHFGYRFFPHHVTERSRPSGCEDLSDVVGPQVPRKVQYVGIVLTGDSKDKLIHAAGGYQHDEAQGDHVTLGFKMTPEMEAWLGQPVGVTVVGSASDADGQAVVVDLPEGVPFRKKGVPHITLSHSSRVGPKYSNEMLARGWSPVRPVALEGVVDTFPSSFRRRKVEA